MSKLLEADDLNIGMFITVLRGEETKRVILARNGPEPDIKENKSFNGKVLKILAIDLPYIIIQFYNVIGKRQTDNLDTREVKLGTVSTEYIKELQPQYLPEVPKEEVIDWIFEQEIGKK